MKNRFINIPMGNGFLNSNLLVKVSDIQGISGLRLDSFTENIEGNKTTYNRYSFEIYVAGTMHRALHCEDKWNVLDNPNLKFTDYVERLYAAITEEWIEDDEVIELIDPDIFIEEE